MVAERSRWAASAIVAVDHTGGNAGWRDQVAARVGSRVDQLRGPGHALGQARTGAGVKDLPEPRCRVVRGPWSVVRGPWVRGMEDVASRSRNALPGGVSEE